MTAASEATGSLLLQGVYLLACHGLSIYGTNGDVSVHGAYYPVCMNEILVCHYLLQWVVLFPLRQMYPKAL